MSNASFEWDKENVRHLDRHEISSLEAEQIIQNRPVDLSAELRDNEERLAQIGETDSGRILIVVSTMRGEKIRVVTAWPAKERLRRYFLTLKRSGHVGRIEEQNLRE